MIKETYGVKPEAVGLYKAFILAGYKENESREAAAKLTGVLPLPEEQIVKIAEAFNKIPLGYMGELQWE